MVTDIVIVIRDEAVTATAIDIIITEDIFYTGDYEGDINKWFWRSWSELWVINVRRERAKAGNLIIDIHPPR